jgi:branched-chain amino acid transport system substrate-binding protein
VCDRHLIGKKIFLSCLVLVLFGYSDQAQSEETIRVGSILSLSGPMATVGEGARRGQQLALEEINSSGGINGKRLEVIFEDSAAEPARAISALNKLANEITYPIIFSSLTSVAQAIKSQTDKRGILLFIEATLPGVLEGTHLALRNFFDSGIIYKELREHLEEQGIKKILILRAEEEWAETALRAFKSGGKKDIDILAEEVVVKGSADIRPQLLRLKAKSKNAEMLILMLIGTDQVTAILQSAQLGINLPKVTHYLCSQQGVLKAVGNSFDGQKSLEGKRDIENSAYKAYLSRYQSAFKSDNPEYNSLTAYDSLMIVAKSLRAGMHSPLDIKNYIIKERQFPGILGVTTFDESGDAVRGGQLEVISNGKCLPIK